MITWALVCMCIKTHNIPENSFIFVTTGMIDSIIVAIIMFGIYKTFG